MLKEFSLILTLLQKHLEACETIVKSASLNTEKLNHSVIKHELNHYLSVLLSFKYEERVKAKGLILEQRIERILKWRLVIDDDSERKFEVQMIILKSWYSKNEINLNVSEENENLILLWRRKSTKNTNEWISKSLKQ